MPDHRLDPDHNFYMLPEIVHWMREHKVSANDCYVDSEDLRRGASKEVYFWFADARMARLFALNWKPD